MRRLLLVLSLLSGLAASAQAGLVIGIDMPAYPTLVPIPGYPVYYGPYQNANYFFYDGRYWVFQGDAWYASSWYNGPWEMIAPMAVPLFVLRIPVRYYRSPPGYFRNWNPNAPPQWGSHWGPGWEQGRRGWNQWNRKAVPAMAPLPAYQRRYTRTNYPRTAQQQHAIQLQNDHYPPLGGAAPAPLPPHPQSERPAPASRQPQSMDSGARSGPDRPRPDKPEQRERQQSQQARPAERGPVRDAEPRVEEPGRRTEQ